jgi:hypothetical protein
MGIVFGILLGDLFVWEEFGKGFWDWCGTLIYGSLVGNTFGAALGNSNFGTRFGTRLGCASPRALGPGFYGNIFGKHWDAFGKGLGYYSFY